MKDSEFLALLNLYVDHEISAADSARLEAEVAGNPARRKLYREYCMMHKACDVLAVHFRDPQNETPSFMVEREKSAGWGWGAGLVTGGLLAAACLAAVFVVHVNQAVKNGASVDKYPAAVATNADFATFHHAVPTHFSTGELQPVLNTRDWTNPTAEQNPSLAWMNNFELAPIQRTALDQLPLFQAAPLLLSTGTAATDIALPTQDTQIERAAFQFQR